jgi:glycerol kinase
MTDDPLYLVLDQGSHASKALLVDARGEVAAAAEVAITTRRPQAGWVEHDPEEIVASLHAAIGEALAQAGASAVARLAGAGLATQRSSIVCWDRETGRPLSPVLSWQDRRHAAWLDAQALDPAELRAVTGLVASAHYGASKLRWCLDHLPEVSAAQAAGGLCCGPLASFVLHWLLEERPCLADPANAARTLLFDLHAGDWSEALLGQFGIPRTCLPRCVPSRHPFGVLLVGGHRVPLTVVTGDQPAALFAWGEPDAATLFVNIGTGAFVQRVFRGAAPAVPGLLEGIAWQDAQRRVSVLEGTVNGAGAALQWLADERGLELESLLRDAPGWLEEVADPPLFLNCVGGLGSPYWDPGCRTGFSSKADIAGETVAVIESIAFLLAVNIEAICATGGPGPVRILATGGLARLDELCQRLADLSGLVVERPGALEATAHGLAWLLSGVVPERLLPARFSPRHSPALAGRYLRCRAMFERAASSGPARASR